MCNAKYQDTDGIVFWNSIDSGTFYTTVPWLARSVESKEAAARCQRTMVDLLGKYMVLQAVNLVWVLLLMGDGMPAFDYYVFHTLFVCRSVAAVQAQVLRGCETEKKASWAAEVSSLAGVVSTARCSPPYLIISGLFFRFPASVLTCLVLLLWQ